MEPGMSSNTLSYGLYLWGDHSLL